jgi:hypothetical protein
VRDREDPQEKSVDAAAVVLERPWVDQWRTRCGEKDAREDRHEHVTEDAAQPTQRATVDARRSAAWRP